MILYSHTFCKLVKGVVIALLMTFGAADIQAQTTSVYCDHFVMQEFNKANGGAFLVPEKFYKKANPGECPKYMGRSCGQFIIPYDQMAAIIGNRSEISAKEINDALGTNLKPGTYIMVWVDTDRKELRLRCPRFAELHRAAEISTCPTNDDCGCNPLFKDGQAKTSGGITEGFVNGVLRSQNYWQEKGIVVLK